MIFNKTTCQVLLEIKKEKMSVHLTETCIKQVTGLPCYTYINIIIINFFLFFEFIFFTLNLSLLLLPHINRIFYSIIITSVNIFVCKNVYWFFSKKKKNSRAFYPPKKIYI